MKIKCPHCEREFTKNGIKGHIWSAHGEGKDHKPTLNKTPWNKGLTKESDIRIKQAGDTLRARYKNNEIQPVGCAAWDTNTRSRVAKKQGFGGYNEKAGRSKKFYVEDSYGKKTCLQSSYELLCSELLDELDIKWERPKHLKYDNKKYFPDFFLTEYNIYLDPKNDYLAKIDEEKINKVCEQNNVKVYILTKDKITKKTLLSLAGKTFDR